MDITSSGCGIIEAFTAKLEEKKQAEHFRQQAHDADFLFYALHQHYSGRPNHEFRNNTNTSQPLSESSCIAPYTRQLTINQANRTSTIMFHLLLLDPPPHAEEGLKQIGADWSAVFHEPENTKIFIFSDKTTGGGS